MADPSADSCPQPMPSSGRVGWRGVVPELAIFGFFLALSVAMTWPWARHLRDSAADTGDPYLNSWILWWDYHGTFTNPLQLFHGNIFFPSRYSLALSEHNYGLALPLFPLFALGLRPLTAQSLLTLLGFAFSGYGAFRLTRTMTGSFGAGLVAGIGFAFTPYRFHQISHVNYLFAGWIPILLEAFIRHARRPTRNGAVWLGVAFFMNALTCIHWFVLTLVPLALTGVVLWMRRRAEIGWRALAPASIAVGVSTLCLLPFLLPYQRAAKLYGLVRNAGETASFSASFVHWFTVDPRNHLWRGLGATPAPGELCLFPGFLLLLLPVVALLLAAPRLPEARLTAPDRSRRLLLALDVLALGAGLVAVFAAVPPGIQLVISGKRIFSATSPTRAIALLAVLLAARWWAAYPKAFTFMRERSLELSLSRPRYPDVIAVGAIWALVGFAGSFGMNGPFHRALWDFVTLFRSVRVPARWAMVAILGLAVLAGAGALELARRAGRRSGLVFGALAIAMLVELRAAPLDLIRGDADPDPVTLRLKATPMKGGIVELPAGGPRGNYRYVLRAADHGKPLITAVSGFITPLVRDIQDLSHQRPVPGKLLEILESVPTSYIVVHEAWLEPDERAALHEFLSKGMTSGRLRFIRRFDKPTRDDLYAVTANEPEAKRETEVPWLAPIVPIAPGRSLQEDPELIGSVDEPVEGELVKGELLVRGWARNPGQDLDVTILIDGESRKPVSFARTPRPGLETIRPNMGSCDTAGYEARYAFSPEDEGAHEILVIFRLGDHVRHYPMRRFSWKPPA